MDLGLAWSLQTSFMFSQMITINSLIRLMHNGLAMKYGYLEGFPTNICSRAQHYKQFGNAVVPRIVADIAQKINKFI